MPSVSLLARGFALGEDTMKTSRAWSCLLLPSPIHALIALAEVFFSIPTSRRISSESDDPRSPPSSPFRRRNTRKIHKKRLLVFGVGILELPPVGVTVSCPTSPESSYTTVPCGRHHSSLELKARVSSGTATPPRLRTLSLRPESLSLSASLFLFLLQWNTELLL